MAENGSKPAGIRSMQVAPELRDDEGGNTLTGHFAVFDQWTEINSATEGNFLERIAPGAFRKTIREGRDKVKALFQHGHDPMVGDKPIGRIDALHEDETGARYEISLYDGVPDLVMSGLRDGAYGSSFRFRAERWDEVEPDGPSDHNPRGLLERTLKEVRLFEFGPVTFPAYAGATAGMRSQTDHFVFEWIEQHPDEVRSLLALDLSDTRSSEAETEEDAPADTDAGSTTSDEGTPRAPSRDYLNREEDPAWRL